MCTAPALSLYTHLVLSRPPSSPARTRQDFGKSLRHISFSWREINYNDEGECVGAQGCEYGPSPLFKGEFTLPGEQQEALLSPYAPPIAPYRPIVLYAKLCDTVCSDSACGNKMSHAGGYRCVWCDRAHCAECVCSCRCNVCGSKHAVVDHFQQFWEKEEMQCRDCCKIVCPSCVRQEFRDHFDDHEAHIRECSRCNTGRCIQCVRKNGDWMVCDRCDGYICETCSSEFPFSGEWKETCHDCSRVMKEMALAAEEGWL